MPTTDEFLEYIDNPKNTKLPKSETDLEPDYTFTALAPFWTLTQAACLLSGLTTIDSFTVMTLIAIDKSYIQKALFKTVEKRPAGKLPCSYSGYIEFVSNELPISLPQIYRLHNFFRILDTAIKNKEIEYASAYITSDKWLIPSEVIQYFVDMKIGFQMELLQAYNQGDKIDYLSIPMNLSD